MSTGGTVGLFDDGDNECDLCEKPLDGDWVWYLMPNGGVGQVLAHRHCGTTMGLIQA